MKQTPFFSSLPLQQLLPIRHFVRLVKDVRYVGVLYGTLLLYILLFSAAQFSPRLLAQEEEVAANAESYRYIRFVAESEVNGNPWSSMAEFYVLDKDGDEIDRESWRIFYVDSQESLREDGRAENSIDDDEDTHWHTVWSFSAPQHPHEIVFDMRKRSQISGFRYLPRQDGSPNGRVAAYSIYGARRQQDAFTLLVSGEFTNSADEQTVYIETADPTSTPTPADTSTATPTATATATPRSTATATTASTPTAGATDRPTPAPTVTPTSVPPTSVPPVTATPATGTPELGSIRGAVWYDWNNDQVRDADELLLEDFRVTFIWAGPDNTLDTDDDDIKSDDTNSRGNYSKPNLVPGLYRIVVQATEKVLASSQNPVVKNAGQLALQQQLAPGQNLEELDLGLFSGDLDGDLIHDGLDGQGDYDDDGTPNYADADADGDGRPDRQEGTRDVNNNGLPDFLDTAAPESQASIQMIKTDFLLIDADLDGIASANDTILYRIDVTNNGQGEIASVVLLDTPDVLTTLLSGTVQSNSGQISRGNAPGDSQVEVALGTLPAGGAATISFQVQVNADAQLGRAQNQAVVVFDAPVGVATGNLLIRSDDPDMPGNADGTVTMVGSSSIHVVHMPIIQR